MRFAFWNNPGVVGKTPYITMALLESANCWQLWQMWTTRTAAGQSPWGWASVNLALILWWNFYRVIAPQENTLARRVTFVGICINALVIASVLYFQHGGA
jgi:hypothetical protein